MSRTYRAGRLPLELVDDDMVARVAVAGTQAECERGIGRLIDAGADEVVFFPFPTTDVERQLPRLAELSRVAR
jgi:alkanesulfonate monooxygenase SsuD/methylene tetrahydromethanopterin reductase-like flavin-dependent oxidoreductase (luciferase family)